MNDMLIAEQKCRFLRNFYEVNQLCNLVAPYAIKDWLSYDGYDVY